MNANQHRYSADNLSRILGSEGKEGIGSCASFDQELCGVSGGKVKKINIILQAAI